MTTKTRAQVRALLDEAARLPKPCAYEAYERLKARLLLCALTEEEYGRAVRALCDALEV